MVEKALEVRGCKVKITKVPIPVPYGPAFEGERIRKVDTYVEFGGNITKAFEFVTSVELGQINDGEIEIIGPTLDQVEEDGSLPLAIWVEVAGRKLQTDFEPILERQIHHMLNGAEGIWHMGQRDIIWTRISKAGFSRGLRLEHYGKIIHAKFLSDYPAIVDKVKVTLITDLAEIEKRLDVARKVYDERDRRLQAMTDESVDTFYSCLLCQSFAPNHVCIITPERLGLCGSYNWLDGKAAFEIDETGPNQPVKKGDCIDPLKGIWQGVDDYVYINSHKTISSFCAYSIIDRPMTSCGCFEVICAYIPECNGVMAVNREYQGDTPVGMTFSTLAGNVGGGQQTPGFMGCGKFFLTSKKFLFADGGIKRLVWMTSELKNLLVVDLKMRFEEQHVPDLLDKIADETIAIDAHDVREFLEQVRHPALEMEDMSLQSEKAPEKDEVKYEEKKTQINAEEAEDTSVFELKNGLKLSKELIGILKEEIIQDLKASISKEIVNEVIQALQSKLLKQDVLSIKKEPVPADQGDAQKELDPTVKVEQKLSRPTAAERLAEISTFDIRKEKCELPIWTVKLGATREEGGTRGCSYIIGGETCMPFHLWEGAMPNRPLIALEVFDQVSEKYPVCLHDIYGDILNQPSEMAKVCVDKYGADLISVRLEATHPEKGNRSAEQAIEVVKNVLDAVDVPLIITGHSHFESINNVMKGVAQTCAGENLLLNWVEQDNYRTIAGAALAYGHAIVAQSPIDVNIAKQMNILLTNMDVKTSQIVMDPMTGATGYGIEYTYSVMERIRLTALNGDKMLSGPMIVTPGQECAKIKELKAPESDFPTWGDLNKRAALWELTTAVNLLYSGADILIMYHPEAAVAVKQTIFKLLDRK
jgi:CO dehydrogenase/CO-methylating acetyl-CoA synthase complex beta subunit/CO dehydrogenase/acetyl-CoA synthase delta subunit